MLCFNSSELNIHIKQLSEKGILYRDTLEYIMRYVIPFELVLIVFEPEEELKELSTFEADRNF